MVPSSLVTWDGAYPDVLKGWGHGDHCAGHFINSIRKLDLKLFFELVDFIFEGDGSCVLGNCRKTDKQDY